MNIVEAGVTSEFNNMTSKPRGTYLDPLKACALSGVSSSAQAVQQSESSTFTKFTGIVRQTRRNASRTSVLNDVEKTRFTEVMKRIDSEKAYSASVLERQARLFRSSLVTIEKHKRSLQKQAGQNKPDAFDGHFRHQQHDDGVPDMLRRHKGRSSRKRGPGVSGIRSKGIAKKRSFNTRLPSISNNSIPEADDEHDESRLVLATDHADEGRALPDLAACPPKSSVISKPSKRTHENLTLPVFMKPGSNHVRVNGDDDTNSTGSGFYTGNDLNRPRRFSVKDISSRSGKLKLPAINSHSQEHITAT